MKLVVISGSGRTGSTLLSLLLSQSQTVFNLGQLRDFAQSFVQGATCTCGISLRDCAIWSQVAQQTFGKSPIADLVDFHQSAIAFRKDAQNTPNWNANASILELKRRHAHFIERLGTMLLATKATTMAEAFVDASKSPEMALAFSLVDGVDLRVLNLVRDPRAVAVSLEKKSGRKKGVQLSRVWVDRQRRLNSWSQTLGNRFLLVRYEDLTNTPSKVTAQILRWAGLEAVPGLFETDSLAVVSWSQQHIYPPANEKVLAEKQTHVNIRLADAWADPVNAETHKVVEIHAGQLMKHFGYRIDQLEGKQRSSESETVWSVAGTISNIASKHPARPALTIGEDTWSYEELLSAALRISTTLKAQSPENPRPITAVMAHRHCSSYLGILAALISGHTYVPISTSHPAKHAAVILRRSGAQQLICGDGATDQLEGILAEAPELQGMLKIIRCSDSKVPADSICKPLPVVNMPQANNAAYILFTSGSTGDPKGVAVNHGNLTSYLDAVNDIMNVTPEDRFSQTFDLTFDLSVHDLMVCWTNGAHLVVPQPCDLADPVAYIREYKISCWFSVPSLAYQARLQNDLQPGSLPSLRWSLFCGEALPTLLAREWVEAAPNSRVENWYGPTETTIACTRFALPRQSTVWNISTDLVPIGFPFDGMKLTICGEDLVPVADGTPGELMLTGRQVADGYLADPLKTAQSFVTVPGQSGIYYRTGDRALRSADGIVHFLGRVDNQVKIRGFRVELGAIEANVRKITHGCNVVAIAWPPGVTAATSVIAVIETETIDEQAMISKLRELLPEYMVPARVICLPRFHTNISGKADRKAIAKTIEARFHFELDRIDHVQLSDQARLLMRSILAVNSNLDPMRIMQADTLLAAGMDSLSFVSFTAEIEEKFSIRLEPTDVVSLAEMSFSEIVDALSRYQPTATHDVSLTIDASSTSLDTKNRANRAIQFVERFRLLLRTIEAPITLAVGSSGVFRGFSPEVFDLTMRAAGINTRSFNVGLPAISCTGISRICEFIRDCCLENRVRLALVIYELDPMQICSLPPPGDISLDPRLFAEHTKSQADDMLDPEFNWQIESGGAGKVSDEPFRKRRFAQWERRRHFEIARTYLGDVEFKQDQIAAWLDGAKALVNVSDRVIGFVHPADPSMIGTVKDRWQGPKLDRVLVEAEGRSGIQIIPWEKFELAGSDFMNINHVNPFSGQRHLTSQLAKFCS